MSKSFFALIVAVCLAVGCLAPSTVCQSAEAPTSVTFPDTYAGQMAQQFLDAFNSGEENLWREYFLQDPKAKDSAEVLQRRMDMTQFLYGDLGGLDARKLVEDNEYMIKFLAEAREPKGPFNWVVLVMAFDSLPPHGIKSIGVQPGDEPGKELPPGKLKPQQMVALLDEYVQSLAAEDRFSGTVLVAKDGQPIYKKAFGQANLRYHVPNQIDTKFNLGSMNKMFTGVAIAQLAEQGKLSFNDLVGKFLPDYPNKEVAEKVTIHHLLTHTSGLSDYWEPLFNSNFTTVRTVQGYAELFWDDTLLFEPGERFQYSNAGPIVLGLIIEKISGQSYFDYVKEHIYKPAGMINSDCYEMDAVVENLAFGYTRTDMDGHPVDGPRRNNMFLHAVRGGPAGGGWSTVEDLFGFAKALQSGQLVGKAYVDTLTTGKEEMGPDMKYGYLFGEEFSDGHRIVGHNGGAPGISAQLDMYVDLGYTVAVLSNYDMMAGVVAGKIGEMIVR
jgi:CubicO group peptidase (beta-lactamase class C family)